MPGYVANPEEAWKRRVEIECYNLGTECLGAVLIDDSVWLEGHEASNSFYLIPRTPEADISYATASFYADCIGFEHDFSALAIPPVYSYLSDSDVPWPCWFSAFREPTPAADFTDKLREGAGVANDLWNGSGTFVAFKYDWLDHPTTKVDGYDVVAVDWTAQFGGVRTALHLYCAALRQVDPLTAYLCFYRCIENLCGDNGKAWIEEAISSNLDTESVAWCDCSPDVIIPEYVKKIVRPDRVSRTHHQREWTNLFELVRALAVFRRDALISTETPSDIARRLYNLNRCGIAHGGNIRTHDLAADFREILMDLKLVRFLSRIAIEDKLNKKD